MGKEAIPREVVYSEPLPEAEGSQAFRAQDILEGDVLN
jgi:hypothetical protein